MPRGGARPTSGRKAMEDTQRVTIVLDEKTRALLKKHGGKSMGAYIRAAMAAQLDDLEAGCEILERPIEGRTANFPLKAPAALLEAANGHVGPGMTFSGLSSFIRTAVVRQVGRAAE